MKLRIDLVGCTFYVHFEKNVTTCPALNIWGGVGVLTCPRPEGDRLGANGYVAKWLQFISVEIVNLRIGKHKQAKIRWVQILYINIYIY
jgi:hypothetical protein